METAFPMHMRGPSCLWAVRTLCVMTFVRRCVCYVDACLAGEVVEVAEGLDVVVAWGTLVILSQEGEEVCDPRVQSAG